MIVIGRQDHCCLGVASLYAECHCLKVPGIEGDRNRNTCGLVDRGTSSVALAHHNLFGWYSNEVIVAPNLTVLKESLLSI